MPSKKVRKVTAHPKVVSDAISCSLEDLFKDGTLPSLTAKEKRAAKNRKRVVISAEKVRGKYTFTVEGSNFDAESLCVFLDALEAAGDLCRKGDDYGVFMILPVIPEREDPKLMKELRRRLKDVQSGKVKPISLETMLRKGKRKP
jgi:hypothetical protein